MDGVSAILGVVAFSASAFEACVKGLVILSKARSYSRDVSGISLVFELEMHKLFAWAEEVGLSREDPVLLVDAQYAPVVQKVLQHLQVLVTDIAKLKHLYGLQLQEATDQVAVSNADDFALARLGFDSDHDHSQILHRIFKRSNRPWKALRWAVFDEQKVKQLLEQIRTLISELQQILDRTRQAKLMRAVDMLVRTAVLNSANEQDLDVIGRDDSHASGGNHVAAAARFKKQGLLLGVIDHAESSIAGQPRPNSRDSAAHSIVPRYSNSALTAMRLSASRLTMYETYTGSEFRMLALYKNAPVLLEFKGESDLDHEVMKDRLYKVSFFLRDLDASFHGLSCIGFVKVHRRYAFVFDLRADIASSHAQPEQLPNVRTLRQLLDDIAAPSLDERLSLAITVLETLLQLHTAGWLHKEFRSDNILFVLRGYKEVSEFLHAPVRIAGYVYARADDAFESTEPLESDLEADLYRHPACLASPRAHFRKDFDIFSVGCIMLELGLWSSLTRILRAASGGNVDGNLPRGDLLKARHDLLVQNIVSAPSPETSRDARRAGCQADRIWRELEAAMGKAYAHVVSQMLYAASDLVDVQRSDLQQVSTSRELLRLEFDCLEKLRTIAEVLGNTTSG